MDLSKIAFIGTCVVVAFMGAFGFGLYSGHYQNSIFFFLSETKDAIVQNVAAVRETAIFTPTGHLQPVREDGDGVTINNLPNDESLVFLSGFFDGGNELRLIRRDGSIVARWPVKFSALFPDDSFLEEPPTTDWNVDLHGALAQRDGSVVFNFESSGLVKLDRCGKTVWTVEHATHHSIEEAEDGSFWVPGRHIVKKGEPRLKPFFPPYTEDLILHISQDGKVLSEMSVPKIMYENGLEAVLTATGERFWERRPWDMELVHLNKIGVLDSKMAESFRDFEAGNLLLSIRGLNLVMVMDPESRKVIWWQTGPWLRQHDPEFNKDGTLTVFNNNLYDSSLVRGDRTGPSGPRPTNIIRVDPVTRETKVVFGNKPTQGLMSVQRGKHQVTEDGGFFITEAEGGRVIEADKDGNILWEFINRYDEKNVAEMTEGRVYPPGYFTVENWSCTPVSPSLEQ